MGGCIGCKRYCRRDRSGGHGRRPATVNAALDCLEAMLTHGPANPIMREWYERQAGMLTGANPMEAARPRVMIAVAELERAAAQYGE